MWDEAHRVSYHVQISRYVVTMYRSQDMWDEAHRVSYHVQILRYVG
jgi:hypothetical protein